MSCYNNLHESFANLDRKALTPTHVSDDPLTNPGRAVRNGKAFIENSNPPNNLQGTAIDSEHNGELLIRDLSSWGTDYILDMRVVNTDTASYIQNPTEKILVISERKNKCKHLNSSIQQRCQFFLFVVSADGLMGTNAEATLGCLASRLATKRLKPYFWTCRYVWSRVAVTMVRSTQCCIRGYQVPEIWISVHRPQWEDDTILHLYLYIGEGNI